MKASREIEASFYCVRINSMILPMFKYIGLEVLVNLGFWEDPF